MASLTQVAIWFIIGLGIYTFRGTFNISADVAGILFNPVFIVFFIIYLILGYLLYSTMFALIGSIVNTDKEAQNFIFPITISLMFPIIIAMYIVQEPDSLVAVVLSLIPFFAPTMMVIRLNFTGVDSFSLGNPMVLQAVIGVIITLLAIIGIIWITGKIFRVGILMYGKRPTLPEIIKWIKY
jgi:ABC-2 type transport system permease protein